MSKNADFTMSFVVAQTPEQVFEAISRPQAWWSEDIEGDATRLGALFYYHYQDIHRGTFKVTELVPGKRVVWHVVQNYFNFVADPTEWTGTDIVFEITPDAKGTELRFTHVGLVPTEECYGVCHDSWRFYLGSSLRNLIAEGVGAPNKGGANANPTVVPSRDEVGARAMAGDHDEVIVLTTAAAKPGEEEKVRAELRAVSEAARKMPGCLGYDVLRSETEANVTTCVERWRSRAEREQFLESSEVTSFAAAVKGAFLQRPSPIAYKML